MITWSKRERIGGDRSFKLLAGSLCLLSYSQEMFEYPKKGGSQKNQSDGRTAQDRSRGRRDMKRKL